MASCVIVLGTTDDETQKLYIINLYNFTMGKSKAPTLLKSLIQLRLH